MKKGNLLVVALHTFVLGIFLLMQGCATGDCPIDWLNWPYNSPNEEPLILPDHNYSDTTDFSDIVSLPPVIMDEPVVSDIEESPEVLPMPSAPGQTYVVKKGDTLSGIASMYGTTWKKLAEYNSLSNPNKLLVGQKLSIPGSLNSAAPVTRSSTPTASYT
ncbi:MAG: LysM peptidoglycan-binding domain-containing protein, partial [Kiritimatiellaceae bacterium]|nr:LysM peptidoglycan-binding domain-containing protein [Kiritimatiellaceae bacterium]